VIRYVRFERPPVMSSNSRGSASEGMRDDNHRETADTSIPVMSSVDPTVFLPHEWPHAIGAVMVVARPESERALGPSILGS
jgi:hypothetical protein